MQQALAGRPSNLLLVVPFMIHKK